MKSLLIDSHGRQLNYLRFSVTDKCNLRCQYCMPADGVKWMHQEKMASTAECLRMLAIFHQCGITKIRFTGGEPFIRKDFQSILLHIAEENLFEQIHITTNGTLGREVLLSLPGNLISGINLSLDSLRPETYLAITRRNVLPEVMNFFHLLQEIQIPTKINMVVMKDLNENEIIDMIMWAKDFPVEVRFIEEMPFNGTGKYSPTQWDFHKIKEVIHSAFPNMNELPFKNGDTSRRYSIEGFKATIGIIAAWSRSFCGQCNRIRLTAAGQVRTCLYSNSGFSVLEKIRAGASDNEIIENLLQAVMAKAKDGFIAEHNQLMHPSMTQIGG